TALQLNPALRVSIADLDAEVVAAAKRHFDQTVFDHPHVEIHFADALTFLSSRNGPPVDGIVCDLTDQPVTSDSSDREQSYRGFFAHLLTLAKSHLKPGGWISLQAGASFATPRYLQASRILPGLVMSHFHSVSSQDLLIPSFGEENRFIIGWKT
ncbi:MAG TPA: hypothetical protein VIT23_04640, partial [Terrimicrobiaceae bacterium]